MTRARAIASVQIHGPVLRHLREQHGRTIGQLARAAGVSTSFLARVERGVKRGVGADVFRTLVAELELTDPRVLCATPYAPAVARVIAAHCEQVDTTVLPCGSTDRAA